MTNFEKWKSELTPEDMIVTDFGFSMGCCAFYGHYDECLNCPARDGCPDGGEDISCPDAFLRWANAKAEGGMDYENLAKKVIERLDKMTDEELNKDFRDYCGLTDEDFLEDAGSEEENEE